MYVLRKENVASLVAWGPARVSRRLFDCATDAVEGSSVSRSGDTLPTEKDPHFIKDQERKNQWLAGCVVGGRARLPIESEPLSIVSALLSFFVQGKFRHLHESFDEALKYISLAQLSFSSSLYSVRPHQTQICVV